MPLTPFHLGPALVLGYFLRRRVHWPTFILANVIPDVEGLLVIMGLLRAYPLHGYLHTLLASVAAGPLLGYALFLADPLLRGVFRALHLTEGEMGLRSYALGGVLGWAAHVLLDAPLYTDIRPLYPLEANPLLLPESLVGAYLDAVTLLLLAGAAIYAAHARRASRGASPPSR